MRMLHVRDRTGFPVFSGWYVGASARSIKVADTSTQPASFLVLRRLRHVLLLIFVLDAFAGLVSVLRLILISDPGRKSGTRSHDDDSVAHFDSPCVSSLVNGGKTDVVDLRKHLRPFSMLKHLSKNAALHSD